MLHSEMAEDPPEVIPWFFTHGNCDKSAGISKILKIKECPALLQCDNLVKTQEWKLNLLHQDTMDKKENQNTKIKLDETILLLPMLELIDRLTGQLKHIASIILARQRG